MLRRSVILAGFTGVSQIILAVLYVVAAREAGPALLGSVVATVAIATFAASLIDFGSNNYWVRETVSGRYTRKILYSKILSKLLYFLSIAIGVTAVMIAMNFSSTYNFLGILFLCVGFYQCSLVPLRAAGSSSRLSFIAMAERTLAFALFLVLLRAGTPAHVALLASLCFGSALSGILAYVIAPKQYRIVGTFGIVLWPWKNTLSYGFSNAAISAQLLDAVILHSVAGPVAAGVYGAVNRWTQPLSVFAKAFATVGLPIVVRSGSIRTSYQYLRRSWYMLAIAGFLCIGVALASPLIVRYILGPEYQGSSAVLAILAIATIPALFNQPLLVFVQALGKEKESALAMSVCVVLQLLLCLYLGHVWSEVGAAVAYLCFQCVLLVFFIALLTKRTRPLSDAKMLDKPVSLKN